MRVTVRQTQSDRPESVAADLPVSKSHLQRALLLAGLLPGRRCLFDVGRNDDIDVCRGAIEALGAHVDEDANDWVVGGVANEAVDAEPRAIWCGENGTTTRMVGAAAAVLGRWVALDGEPGLRRRPLDALAEVLAEASIDCGTNRLPMTIDGRGAAWPDVVDVDASTTTQVASGLLIGLAVRHARGLMPSPRALRVHAPRAGAYVELTAHIARQFGLPVTGHADDAAWTFEFEPVDSRIVNWTAVRDASAAAFPVVLAAMHRAKAVLPEHQGDPHPDWGISEDARAMTAAAAGAEVVIEGLGRRPDTFPALAALAATRDGTTRLTGAPALRHKESDRIAAMHDGLTALGVRCEPLDDGLVVHGAIDTTQPEARVATPADHRILMAFGVLGARLPNGLVLESAEAVGKSWPGFWNWLADYAVVERAE